MDVVPTSEGQNNPPASGADKLTVDSNTDAEESIKENIVGAESTT